MKPLSLTAILLLAILAITPSPIDGQAKKPSKFSKHDYPIVVTFREWALVAANLDIIRGHEVSGRRPAYVYFDKKAQLFKGVVRVDKDWSTESVSSVNMMVLDDSGNAMTALQQVFPEITDNDFYEEFVWVKSEKVGNDFKFTRVVLAEWKNGKVIIH